MSVARQSSSSGQKPALKALSENIHFKENTPTKFSGPYFGHTKSQTDSSRSISSIDSSSDYAFQNQAKFEVDLGLLLRNSFKPTQDKAYFSLDIESLKSSILNLLRESSFLFSNTKKPTLTEEAMRKKIVELEKDHSRYEKKIKEHLDYITGLENKVNLLIVEYQKTVANNENLNKEIENLNKSLVSQRLKSNRGDSVPRDIKTNRSRNEIDANTSAEQSSFLIHESSIIHKDTSLIHEHFEKLSQEHRELQKELDRVNNQSRAATERERQLVDEVQYLKQTQTSERINRHEVVVYMKQIETLQLDLEQLIEANKILARRNESYQEEVSTLKDNLNVTNQNLSSLQTRCMLLENELSNKNKLEEMINTYLPLISDLEEKVNSLAEENRRLQKMTSEQAVLNEGLKNEILIANQNFNNASLELNTALESAKSRESFQAEVEQAKKEFQEKFIDLQTQREVELNIERINHKSQIEKYNTNLEILSGKIQALVYVNEKQSRDFECLKMEFNNYRIIAWSVLQEFKKTMESFRRLNFDIEVGLNSLIESHPELIKLKDMNIQQKVYINYAEHLLEDREKLI